MREKLKIKAMLTDIDEGVRKLGFSQAPDLALSLPTRTFVGTVRKLNFPM